MRILAKSFYAKDPKKVAISLLGKLLVRVYKGKVLSGIIVETEAYYGQQDPASRAYKGKNKISELMFDEPGRALIYMVHNNWLFNVTCLPKGKAGAVLIRALQPLQGIELMKKFRKGKGLHELTNGPGKLTQALKIDKSLHGIYVYKKDSSIKILDYKKISKKEIASSNRIGVSKDLPEHLRFFIKGNEFVSRRS